VQCAWAVVRKKEGYFRGKYYSLVSRMGCKKALCAIAHKLLLSIYYVLKEKEFYKDFGENYVKKNNKEKLVKHHIKQLSKLGYEGTIISV